MRDLNNKLSINRDSDIEISISQKVFNNVNLKKKYDVINSFLDSTFKVTNEALPSMAKYNPIMSELVLKELRIIDITIQNDREKISKECIDILDILTNRISEVSYFIYNLIIHRNPYEYKSLENDFKVYQNVQALEKTFPLEKRKKIMKDLENEINKVNDIISAISEVDNSVNRTYSNKLLELQNEYESIKRTVIFKSLEEIRDDIYNKLVFNLDSIHERVRNKIVFLEKVLDDDYE
ncbi:hypothetical protein [Clostridium perfringens]|uniref:hypothetical protein n=1 Tax=Clostridium perfringens TaxID=1502 RepID=UPI001038BD6E|nr:hypothetical protein [Clostridium perfringens]MBS5996227.1 hypothetical protein [Clostridium perfringens]MDK0678017.1 hypothetical protein [Clostridium perfringens]MDM0909642.1 hypothetical protein [Clostridium perfringens]MDM0924003.1 hypothetical protein [Clostridium perfringens]MDU2436095.1 hypothetical protein [Clostridium perfringens]